MNLSQFFHTQGHWFFPICVPLLFVAVNLLVKGGLNLLNPGLIGADSAFSGCGLLVGGLIRSALSANVDNTDILGAFGIILLAGIFWFGCLLLGRLQDWFWKGLAGFVGAAVLAVSVVYCWYLTK